MSIDAISAIRQAEERAEVAEREAKDAAHELINRAKSTAKEIIASEISTANTNAKEKLSELEKENDSSIQKAEVEILKEVELLRKQAEDKKKEVAKAVAEMLF